MIAKNEKPFVTVLGVPFDDTELSMAIYRGAFAYGKFYPTTRPTDAELDRFEATGELAPRHAAGAPLDDRTARDQSKIRQQAINSCAPKYRLWVKAMIEMADMLPAVADALDSVVSSGRAERTYTIDQLRKAWGAGVHAAKDGRV